MSELEGLLLFSFCKGVDLAMAPTLVDVPPIFMVPYNKSYIIFIASSSYLFCFILLSKSSIIYNLADFLSLLLLLDKSIISL